MINRTKRLLWALFPGGSPPAYEPRRQGGRECERAVTWMYSTTGLGVVSVWKQYRPTPGPIAAYLKIRSAAGAVNYYDACRGGMPGESRALRGLVKASSSGVGSGGSPVEDSRVEGVEAGGYRQKVSSGPRRCEGGWSLNQGGE